MGCHESAPEGAVQSEGLRPKRVDHKKTVCYQPMLVVFMLVNATVRLDVPRKQVKILREWITHTQKKLL